MSVPEFKSLNEDFVVELFGISLSSNNMFELFKQHLKFSYLQNDTQKTVWKTICDNYEVFGKSPTIGTIAQQFNKDKEVIAFLRKIKDIRVFDKQDQITHRFEEFIKNAAFVNVHNDAADMFNKGDNKKAIQFLSDESKKIHDFSIVDKTHTKLFESFSKRNQQRINRSDNEVFNEKVPFSIPQIDNDTKGGGRKGTSTLILGQSGKGKSTLLKWIGASGARLGNKVVHFQAEGLEEETLDLYDSCWTSVPIDEMCEGNISDELMKKIETARKNILIRGGEIIIKSAQEFDSMSIDNCREFLLDVQKQWGHIDLVIFDYLELFTVKGQYGTGDSSERKRRNDIAQKITNIAIEFRCHTVTATQANDIRPEIYNDPDFVLTRTHISEYKGCVKPFSYFFTLNQTDEEYEQGVFRIYADKYRRHKAKKTYKVWASMDNCRFYDHMRTQIEQAKLSY